MNYLGAWAAIGVFALLASIVVGKRAGYGLIAVVILFVILTGWSRFAPALGGNTSQ